MMNNCQDQYNKLKSSRMWRYISVVFKRKPTLCISLAIITLWVATFFGALMAEEDKAANLGDSFGTINALFSGGALAGVVIAILLQRKELKLQRRELSLTRSELEKSADAQKSQVEVNAASALMAAIESRLSQMQNDKRILSERMEFYRRHIEDCEKQIEQWTEKKQSEEYFTSFVPGDEISKAKSKINEYGKEREMEKEKLDSLSAKIKEAEDYLDGMRKRLWNKIPQDLKLQEPF